MIGSPLLGQCGQGGLLPSVPTYRGAPSVRQPGLQHQFTEALRAVATCVPASAALLSRTLLHQDPPQRQAFMGQCAPC